MKDQKNIKKKIDSLKTKEKICDVLTGKKIVINVDGIRPVPQSLIEEARDELAKLLVEQCRAELKTDVLNKNKREIELDL